MGASPRVPLSRRALVLVEASSPKRSLKKGTRRARVRSKQDHDGGSGRKEAFPRRASQLELTRGNNSPEVLDDLTAGLILCCLKSLARPLFRYSHEAWSPSGSQSPRRLGSLLSFPDGWPD